MSGPHRVLLVSFFYPPDPAVGGLRVAKFARYLPDFGWDPTVLTARTADGAAPDPRVHSAHFASPWRVLRRHQPAAHAGQPPPVSLRERAAGGGPMARHAYAALRHLLPMSSVRMPDATSGWIRHAVALGRELLRAQPFDAIFSSAGPPSSHRVAARLQRISGLPWIADYRDLWSDNHWDARVPPFRWIERRIERRVLRRATQLTTVGSAWAARLARLHDKPVQVIYNGYDPSDYPPGPPPASRFEIIYIGSLYYPDQSPTPLFEAMARLNEMGTAPASPRLHVRFVGTESAPLASLARRYGISDQVHFSPAVPHTQSLALQTAATALLYLGWREPAQGFISAKIFEYLGAGRPILAVGPPGGEISHILQACGLDDLTADPPTIADRLQLWLRELDRHGALTPRRPGPNAADYTRQAQTGRLAGLLDRLANRQSPCG
jgi:glycosyltransferase involved in cell wall biosynthesis